MTSMGTVREFHPDEGWGVIDSQEVPGGCWVFFDAIIMDGYRELRPGEHVRFNFESVADQDGYLFRATKVWPSGVATDEEENAEGTLGAYGSNLMLVYDEPAPEE